MRPGTYTHILRPGGLRLIEDLGTGPVSGPVSGPLSLSYPTSNHLSQAIICREPQSVSVQGIIPIRGDYKRIMTAGGSFSKGKTMALLMGQSSGAVTDVQPAAQIVNEMMTMAIQILRTNASLIGAAKL